VNFSKGYRKALFHCNGWIRAFLFGDELGRRKEMAEDIKGLPDVDLSAVVKDIQDQDKDQKVTDTKVGDDKLDLGQFKNPKDMLKSYKEIQAAFTRVTQENKSFKEQMTQLNEQVELAKLGAGQSIQQPQQQQYGYEEDVDQKVMRLVATQRIAETLEEEAEKNKPEFQERYAYAQMISREYPQLATTSRGVKKLFELGDKLRQDNLRKNAGKALESIFGEPLNEEEINKLRTMVKGDKAIKQRTDQTNAYMPDTSTSTKSGSDQSQKPNAELKIKESVKKGDVDGVISAMFEDIVTAE